MSSLPQRVHSPPPPPRGGEDRDRFSRANFGPIPKRHDADLIAAGSGGAVGGGDTYIPPPPDPARHREPLPVRERDLVGGAGGGGGGGRDVRDERGGREDRGRRPPPHREEDIDRPKRRRSPSPSYPAHRPRRFSPEPDLYTRGGGLSLPDPASLPHQLTFKQFAEWFRAEHPSTAKADEEEFRRFKDGMLPPETAKERVGMGKRYERYKKEYTSRQLFSLYLMHRASPWFVERYSNTPEAKAERKRVNRLGRVPRVEKYLEDLRAGKFDGISYDQPDEQPKRPTASRRYSELEEPENLDRSLGDFNTEDPGKIEIPPLPNQVFVKSVPPTIGRKELEELFAPHAGFQYLAITEPSVKKSFHRVAWAQFADGVDVEAVVKKLDESRISGFVFHMSVNTAATIGRLKYTPPVSSSLQRLLKDAQKAKALAQRLEDELVDAEEALPGGDVQMHEGEEAKADVQDAKGAAVRSLKERGSAAVEEVLGGVLEKEGLADEEESTEEQKVKRAKITLDHWIAYLRHGLSTCFYCVAPMSFSEELQRKCVGHLRAPAIPVKEGLDGVSEEAKPSGEADENSVDVKIAEEAGNEGENAEDKREPTEASAVEAQRDRERNGRGLRDVRGELIPSGRQEERWEESFDMRLAAVIGYGEVVDYGGRDLEEETKKLTAPMIKQEEANKYRCKECSKLFKAPEFVMKHITIKHGEGIQTKLDNFAVFNNFILDPQHLQVNPQVPAAIEDELPQLNSASGVSLLNPSLAFNPDLMPGGNANAKPQQQQQQMMLMMMQMQQAMMMQMQANGGGAAQGGRGGMSMGIGIEGKGLADRMGGYVAGGREGGRGGRNAAGAVAREPLPAPPPGAEDPRARKGRMSYMDLDEMGGGADGGLPY